MWLYSFFDSIVCHRLALHSLCSQECARLYLDPELVKGGITITEDHNSGTMKQSSILLWDPQLLPHIRSIT